MPYYGVANGRNIGVYDNWEDCKDQVHKYSKCDFKKFDTPDEAWDFVDQHSDSFSRERDYVKQPCTSKSSSKALVSKNNNNELARRDYGDCRAYQRTDYQEGKNGYVVRERTYTSGRHGTNGYYVEKRTRTYWETK